MTTFMNLNPPAVRADGARLDTREAWEAARARYLREIERVQREQRAKVRVRLGKRKGAA